jgi:TonB family protein
LAAPLRSLCAGLLLGALAPAALATLPPPATAGASSAAIAEAPLPAWLVVAPPRPPAEIRAAWKAVEGDAMPYPREPSRRDNAAAKASGQAVTPMPNFIDLTSLGAGHAGRWRFHAQRRGAGPHAAWHLTVSDAPPYRVNAQLYCNEASGDCEPLRRELALIQAPRPDSEAVMDEWLRIITSGPCEPGPVHMPAPRFPPQALREEARGTVQLRLAFNACGEVKHASVYRSSGSRHLDRAAVQTARSWRTAFPEGVTGPSQGLVSVRFEIDADAPAD